jgi:hypothetical protein
MNRHERDEIWALFTARVDKAQRDLRAREAEMSHALPKLTLSPKVRTRLAQAQAAIDRLLSALDPALYTMTWTYASLIAGERKYVLGVEETEVARHRRLAPLKKPLVQRQADLTALREQLREGLILCASGKDMRAWFEGAVEQLSKMSTSS